MKNKSSKSKSVSKSRMLGTNKKTSVFNKPTKGAAGARNKQRIKQHRNG